MNERKAKALAIFWVINDFLLDNAGIRKAILDFASGKTDISIFGLSVGPVNAERWSRDLRVIEETLEVIEEGIAV